MADKADVTRLSELELINAITERWMAMNKRAQGLKRSHLDREMDIYYAHKAIPLDLKRLLAADDFNFAHDVYGIERHLERDIDNPRMNDCFLPRFAFTNHDLKRRKKNAK